MAYKATPVNSNCFPESSFRFGLSVSDAAEVAEDHNYFKQRLLSLQSGFQPIPAVAVSLLKTLVTES